MSKSISFHTADDDWLVAYVSGSISPLKRLLIDCQAALQPALTLRIDTLDGIGGAFLESSKGEPLSDEFSRRLSNALQEQPPEPETQTPEEPHGWMPNALRTFLSDGGLSLHWKKSGPGVERASLLKENGERLYLLKAKPGITLPMHSHRGQEWALILQGGYHAQGIGYVRGDLHCEDETCVHQPVIDADGDCISLVVDEGKLRFKNPMMKILQPLIGI